MNIFRCAWNFRCSVIQENSRVTFLPPRSKSTIDAYSNNNNNNSNNNNSNNNNNNNNSNNNNNNNSNNNNNNNNNNNDRETTFKITNTKLYVPIVTLSTKDNVHLRKKQLNEGF